MRLFLFSILIFYPLFAISQAGLIKGEITDMKSGEPIVSATITHGEYSLISDAQGRFEISFSPGKKLVVSAAGYQPDTSSPTSNTSYMQVALSPVSHQLDEVVISGNMRAVRKSESAIPVEIYSASYFAKNPTPSVFEALSTMNGVQPQLNCNICNTGDIHINGMEGPYTMVLIDGMPIISSLSRIYGFSGIPTSLVKRMEVVKGPASTLYGSDAVAGLINIITKDAYSAGKLSADISITSLGEMSADISTGIKTKKVNGILGVNLFNYWTKSDINNDNFTDLTQQRRASVFNKWDFDRSNKLPASVSLRYMAENRWGGELNWNKKFRGSDSIYGESIVTNRFEATGVYGITGGKYNTMLDYSYSFHDQQSYYGTTIFNAKQHLGFAQLRSDVKIGRHQLLVGLPIKYTWYDDNTVITEKDNENAALKQLTAAAFVQDEWKFNDRWLLLTGLRYEYNTIHGGVAAPRLAVKWQPAVNQNIRVSGGNGYRIVNLFTEDHAALTGAREVEITNDLKPERSWNANINYDIQWRSKNIFYNINASLFYTYFNNKIIADYTTDPNKIIYNNLDGYAVSKGLSVNFDVMVKKGLKILGGITLMDVYSMSPNGRGGNQKTRQLFAPVFAANYAVSYRINKWNTTFDLTGKTYGPQKLPIFPNDYRPEYSPWFSIINLQVSKKINQKLEFYLAAKNILNFRPKDPILHADDPFDKPGGKYFDMGGNPRPDTNPYNYTFDPTYSYASMQGIKAQAGARISF